ncbi:uncharacterized protein LOC127711643 isoform X2 [Mytilus californianus]|uniref:uncharacterized protein LOC127711643 isoform X2 n=1 Tax=Mytilus californianus TaxID=6549 RepID=UPI002247C407|nr:uncharacterized protein LOC127711643 isoform X2 [Mytilus californianus]
MDFAQKDDIKESIREKEENSDVEQKIKKRETEQEEVNSRNIRENNEDLDVEQKIKKKETAQEIVIPRNNREKEENSIIGQKIQKKEDAQEEVIPRNIREQIKNQIEDWEKNDKMFVCTRASDYVIECLKNKHCVTLTAPSGVGKSFISRHTALILQKEGYNIIPVYSPQNISDYFQPGKKTVFIIDDICGNFIANQVEILSWRELLPVVNRIIADKSCKIIVSCRLQVYKDGGFNILLPFKSCECNLISDNLRLTPEEKTSIVRSYIDTSKLDIGEICQTSDCFPLLCYLYHEKNCSDVKEFFRNPFGVYKNELDILSMNGEGGNIKMCSLALCVLFNNKLEEEWFQGEVTDEQQYLIEDINDTCDFRIGTSKEKLKKALDNLDGTFVITKNGIYRAAHDKLFDFLAHYVGHKMTKCLIDHGDSHLVHERCIWRKSPDHKNSNIDFIIEIHDDYLESYIKRFIKDWSAGNVVVVFGSYNFRVPSFRQQLLQYLIQLDNSEQVVLANTKDTLLPKENCGSGSTPLICTCNDGYTDMVQWILNNDVDVDQSRIDGNTGLIIACRQGHVDIVRLLLQKNPIIDLCNQNEIEALNWACYKGYTSIVNMLLEKNPNVDLCNLNGITALNWACYKGYNIIVNMLLQKNPNVDLCSIDGRSPLFMASQRGHTDIVRVLLKKNANVNLCTSDGRSPLHIASQNRHTDIVRLLLEKNPNVDLCTNNGKTALTLACGKGYPAIVNMLLDKNPNFDVCVSDGCSPLYMANQNGERMIECFIDYGDSYFVHESFIWQISPDDKNSKIDFFIQIPNDYLESYLNRFIKDWSAGNVIIVFESSNMKVSSFRQHLLQYLTQLENSKQVALANTKNTVFPKHNSGIGSTPLICTCNAGYTDMLLWILNNNVDMDHSRIDRTTGLIMACQEGHVDIVRLLLRENPNVDLCDLNGITALNWACDKGYTIIVNMLLEKNPDVNLCSSDGHSPLYIASQKGYTDIVRLLLDKNPNVHLGSRDGRSPLCIACQNKHTDIVRLLLEKNPDVDLCNNKGKTALFLACGKGYPAIVNMILRKNSNFDVCVSDGCSPLYLANQNGKKMIDCFIDHGDSSFVHERFIWKISPDDKNSKIDFFIKIPDEYLKSYLKRFIKDWSVGNLKVVFESSNIKVSSFRQQLLQYLVQLDKSEQVALANTKDTVFPKHLFGSNNTPLISSCNQGYTDMVQWILNNDVDVDQCRDDKVTGLIMACHEGHVDIVRLLLQENPNVDLCDMNGNTALLWACFKGYANIVNMLLERNPNVDLFSSDGRSPLYMASQKGHTDIVRLLLDQNPNVDQCSSDGRSPLCIASQQGHTDIVRLLLDKNPNVDLCDSDSCSPLSMSSLNGHTDIVRLLLEKNPNVDLCTHYGKTALNLACDNGYTAIVNKLLDKNPNVDLCDSDGCSPLYTASQKGYTDIVRLLLDKHPNVHLGSRDGHRPLYIASQKGYTAIVRLLIHNNPNVDLCDNDGCSPLSKASLNGHTDIVRLLLDKNPNVDLCDSDGCSPLSMASQNGHTNIVRLLLEQNPNVDLCGNHCLTPLIHLCKRDDTSVVKLLLRHKPAINFQTLLGGNALHFSVMNGNIEITQLLLENNADCNVCVHSKQTITDAIYTLSPPALDRFKQTLFVNFLEDTLSNVADYVSKKSEDYTFDVWAGSSPLHIACFFGTIDIVDCLLGYNANINMTKEDGTTPLIYACEVGHEDVVRLLLDKGADTEILRLDRKSALNIATDNGHKSIVPMITKHLKGENNASK